MSTETRRSAEIKSQAIKCKVHEMTFGGLVYIGTKIISRDNVPKITLFKIKKKNKPLLLKEKKNNETILPDLGEPDFEDPFIPFIPPIQMLSDDSDPGEIAKSLWETIPKEHPGKVHRKKKTKQKRYLFTHYKRHS